MKPLLILTLLAAPCVGDHCRNRVVHLDTGLQVVPFSTPVGVPLATVAVGQPLYSVGQGYQQPAPQAAVLDERAQLIADIIAVLDAREGRVKALAKPKSPLQKSCVSCHSGASPKKGIDLSGPIDDALARKASRQVLLGKMPPGKPLGPEDAGKVLEELAGEAPTVKTQEVPLPAKPKE